MKKIHLSLFSKFDFLCAHVHRELTLNWNGKRNNMFIVGSLSQQFSDFKKSLWSVYAEKLFPYVEETNDFADVSPLICSSTTTENINSAIKAFIVERVISSDNIQLMDFEAVDFLFTNKDEFEVQISILNSLNVEFDTLLVDESSINNRGENRSFYKKSPNSISINSDSKYNSNQNDISQMYNGNKNYSSNNNNNYSGGKREYSSNSNYKKIEKAILVYKPFVLSSKLEFDLSNYLLKNNFCISYLSRKKLPLDVWKEFYIDSSSHAWYSSMCTYLSSTHVYIGIVEGDGVISRARALLGDKDPSKCEPHHIRKMFGRDLDDNGLHVSASPSDYEKEKNALFGARKN